MAGLQTVDVGQVDRVHRLAVDVQLQLVGGAVADAHRAGAAPALEVVERLLDQVGAAVHPVHDLQRAAAVRRAVGGAVQQPPAERGGFIEVAQAEQGVDGERAVPDPGVPVVPVALAAGLLGQPGGRRGHQRAAGRVRHQLQRHRGPGHHLPPAAVVGRAVQPAPPELRGLVLQSLRLLGGDPAGRAAVRLQHHPAHFAFAQRPRPPHAVAHPLQADARILEGQPLRRDGVRGELQAVGREHPAVLGGFQLVRGPAVVEARLYLDREPHHAPHDADVAHQPVPVGRGCPGDGHEVVHLADPVRGHEPGDQDRGVGQVQLPGHVVVPVRRDLVEAAPVGVQQRREHAGRVEPGDAEPVQDAVRGHQRRRLQVADQAVISNVRIAIHGRLLAPRRVQDQILTWMDNATIRIGVRRVIALKGVTLAYTLPRHRIYFSRPGPSGCRRQSRLRCRR
jgi:hypothetical protein